MTSASDLKSKIDNLQAELDDFIQKAQQEIAFRQGKIAALRDMLSELENQENAPQSAANDSNSLPPPEGEQTQE